MAKEIEKAYSPKSYQLLLSKWSSIEVQSIVGVLHELSRGDGRKLIQDYHRLDGIYAEASKRIFSSNELLHRRLIYSTWAGNRESAREIYAKLCGKRFKPGNKNLRISIENNSSCWCRQSCNDKDPSSVKCDQCGRWSHCECSGITAQQALSIEEFRCLRCKNNPAIPSLFLTPYRGPSDRFVAYQRSKEDDSIGTKDQNVQDVEDHLSDASGSANESTYETRSGIQQRLFTSPYSASHYSATSNEKRSSAESDIPARNSETEDSLRSSALFPKHSDNVPSRSPSDAGSSQDSISAPVVEVSGRAYYDTSTVPPYFILKLKPEIWTQIVKRVEVRKGIWVYQIQKDCHDLLALEFYKKNKFCVPLFNKTKVNQPEDVVTASFFRTNVYCKGHKNECTAKYSFMVQEVPRDGAEYVPMSVRRTSGAISHYKGEKLKRPLKGKRRAEAKEEMKKMKPSMYHNKLYQTADPELLAVGNLDWVKTLKVLQQASVEDNAKDDFSQDVIVDLLATCFHQRKLESHPKLPGFLQRISIVPFYMVLFSAPQLELLWSLSQSTDIVLFLDGSGTLARKLPEPFDQTRIFYCALVIKHTAGFPVVPVAEFYTAKQDVEILETFLRCFIYTYKKFCRIRGNSFRIARMEIDFSKALLAAVIKTFVGIDTEGYLWLIWNSLDKQTSLPDLFIAVHICRIHVYRFWKRSLRRYFMGKQKTGIKNFWFNWLTRFIKSKDLWSIHRRMVDILMISGTQYLTDEVNLLIANINKPTPRSGVEPWASYDLTEIDPNGPFSRRSPFGHVAYLIGQGIDRKNTATRSRVQARQINLNENPLYSTLFYDYATRDFLPYAPLFTLVPFELLNLPIVNDNTNPVENWMNLLKRIFFQGQRNQKVSRLARAHCDLAKGEIRKAATASGSLEKMRELDRNLENVECSSSDFSEIGISDDDEPLKTTEGNPQQTECATTPTLATASSNTQASTRLQEPQLSHKQQSGSSNIKLQSLSSLLPPKSLRQQVAVKSHVRSGPERMQNVAESPISESRSNNRKSDQASKSRKEKHQKSSNVTSTKSPPQISLDYDPTNYEATVKNIMDKLGVSTAKPTAPSKDLVRKGRVAKSPETEVDQWGKPVKEDSFFTRSHSSYIFTMPLIPLNVDATIAGKTISITNTCNFDCTIQVLYWLYYYNQPARKWFESQSDEKWLRVSNVINHDYNEEPDLARIYWMTSVLGRQMKPSQNMWGSEREHGLDPIRSLFNTVRQASICCNVNCPESKRERHLRIAPFDIHVLNSKQMLEFFNTGHTKPSMCQICAGECSYRYNFYGSFPEILVYTCDGRMSQKDDNGQIVETRYALEKDLPMTQTFQGAVYDVVAYTMFTGTHFYVVYNTAGGQFTYDGKEIPMLSSRREKPPTHTVSTVWMSLKPN